MIASASAIISISIKIHTVIVAMNYYFIRILKMNQNNFKFNWSQSNLVNLIIFLSYWLHHHHYYLGFNYISYY